jgi:hypothetical protein
MKVIRKLVLILYQERKLTEFLCVIKSTECLATVQQDLTVLYQVPYLRYLNNPVGWRLAKLACGGVAPAPRSVVAHHQEP